MIKGCAIANRVDESLDQVDATLLPQSKQVALLPTTISSAIERLLLLYCTAPIKNDRIIFGLICSYNIEAHAEYSRNVLEEACYLMHQY